MSRSIRLLNLLQQLREARYPITAQVLAERLEISVRSVYRDIDSLREQGVRIEASAGLGFQLKEDILLPPITFNEDEAEALFLAVEWLKEVPDQSLKSAAVSIYSKLYAVLPKYRKYLLDDMTLGVAHYWYPVDETLVAQVRIAIRNQVKIKVDYCDEQNRLSERSLWPFALGYLNGKVVLAAWCELRQAFRHFRIDRIHQLHISQDSYPEFKKLLFQKWWKQEMQNATDKN
ncbi:YafY family protein [Acinetobacter pittii]|uniref:helix-turn-helix transcriptional regulator n=1 Tax=Acinetobacter pittii TaxID=48296 RepID=UPI002A07E77B|nr:YafY family protein [Acinetobacter pittii]MDX8254409.1 YafY family protein [Acinetobacter pittii]